jgi:hypothetical protein
MAPRSNAWWWMLQQARPVLLVKYRHSVTGQSHKQAKYLWFIARDNGLTVAEYLVSGDWKDFDYTLCSLQQPSASILWSSDRQRGKTP